nr:CocE/NonD family hydrolase [Candidatus Sigynarchaeota archaeon]
MDFFNAFFNFIAGDRHAEFNIPIIAVSLLVYILSVAVGLNSSHTTKRDINGNGILPLGKYIREALIVFLVGAVPVVVTIIARPIMKAIYGWFLPIVLVGCILAVFAVACQFRHLVNEPGEPAIDRAARRWLFAEVAVAFLAGTFNAEIAMVIALFITIKIGVHSVALSRSATEHGWKAVHGIAGIAFLIGIPAGIAIAVVTTDYHLEMIAGCFGTALGYVIHAKALKGLASELASGGPRLASFKNSARREKATLLVGMTFLALVPVALVSNAPVVDHLMIPMRDGVRLATIVYRPAFQVGGMPVLLLRTPYCQNCSVFNFPDEAMRWCSKGYIVVTQDVRGRFASEGTWDGMLMAGDDAYDTCTWIVSQPWCNGRIGTYGASAMGMTQLFAGGAGCPGLIAQEILVGTGDMYNTYFRQGAWAMADAGSWIRGNAGGDWLNDEFLAHPNKTADFWYNGSIAMGNKYANVNTRSLHISGWYDVFMQQSLDAFLGYYYNGSEYARGHQKLIIGPWWHGIGGEECGQLVFPDASVYPREKWREAIFAENLAPARLTNGIIDVPTLWNEPNIAYYLMGANEWRYTNDWPVPHATRLVLKLQPDSSISNVVPGSEKNFSYIYDPLRPMQTLGGTNLVFNTTYLPYLENTTYDVSLGVGPWDQRPLLTRPDVLVFTSDVVSFPFNVVGRVTANLWISSNCTDTDFVVKICDVYPDGRSMLVVDGIANVRKQNGVDKDELIVPGSVYAIDVDCWSTAIRFEVGHKIQVIIGSSNTPRYQPCPNTGAPLNRTYSTFYDANNTILVGGAHCSAITVPLVP